MKSSSQKNEIELCPYLNDKECGFPNKNPKRFCEHYKNCWSYRILEETRKIFKEEKKDG